MKKLLSLVVVLLMISATFVPCIHAAEPSLNGNIPVAVLGDADFDASITVRDATAIQKHIAGLSLLPDDALYLADTNNDSDINIKDATEIQKHIADIDSYECIGKEIEDTSTLPQNQGTTATENKENQEFRDSSIPFTIAEEGRILDYVGSDKAVLYLARNAEEANIALSEIDVDPRYLDYLNPTLDSKYDTSYFADNSLIFFLSCVGGGCCSQSINSLMRQGNTITLHRTTRSPENPTCDMNYQYVLIEVSKKHTEGVTNFEVVSTHKYLQDNSGNGAKDTMTIYYTNNKYWNAVNIYYWSNNSDTNWPGIQMEFVGKNDYGQEIYKYDIPTDAEGVVFNGGEEQPQTIDVYDLSDGKGFFATQFDGFKWEVGSYLFSEEILSTTNDTTTSVINTQPTFPAPTDYENAISFRVAEKQRIQGYVSEDIGWSLNLAYSVEDLETALDAIYGEPDNSYLSKPVRDEKYNEEYFEENAVIVALYSLSSGSYTYTIDSLTVDDDVLTIHKSIFKPEVSTCDMNYQYALIEVSKADIAPVKTLADSNTYYYLFDEYI